MLSYKEYLLEGILRVDKELLDFLESCFFVCLYNDKKDSLSSEQIIKFNQLEKKYKSIHDSYVKKYEIVYSGNQYLNIPYDHNGFKGNFNFVLDKKSKSLTGAEFHHGNIQTGKQRKIVVYYDDVFREQFYNWLRKPNLENLELIIKEKRNQIEHELAHGVETFIMDKKGNTKKIKKNYNTDYKDYLTSDIEFEPMTISLIRDFTLKIKKFKIDNKEPMSLEYYKFLAKDLLSPVSEYDWNKDFLIYYHKVSPIKLKTILKKAYVEIMDNIEELKKEGYIE